MREIAQPPSLDERDVSHCFLPIFLLFGLGASDRRAAGPRGGRVTPFVGARAPYGGPIRARSIPPRAMGGAPMTQPRTVVRYPGRPY